MRIFLMMKEMVKSWFNKKKSKVFRYIDYYQNLVAIIFTKGNWLKIL